LGPDIPLPAQVLDPGTTVVAVSQGTVDNADTDKLIVSTLEALAGGPYVVVATTAGTRTQQLRERFAAPNVVIEDFINYDDLFPHVDVFVTNGGFGSVLAAMRHGVPVVAAGQREGKNDINARVGGNRLGVDLRGERPKPARIRDAVRPVLDDPAYATNVAKLRAVLDSYDPMARIDAALHAVSVATS
jgi:UDP:flavonoid glycosyltransferase YjiC (YdhE family)